MRTTRPRAWRAPHQLRPDLVSEREVLDVRLKAVNRRSSRGGSVCNDWRKRAAVEILELGPIPAEKRTREMWATERRGAVVLLVGLADWDAALLNGAALGFASE